jgi:hypothetical protein
VFERHAFFDMPTAGAADAAKETNEKR